MICRHYNYEVYMVFDIINYVVFLPDKELQPVGSRFYGDWSYWPKSVQAGVSIISVTTTLIYSHHLTSLECPANYNRAISRQFEIR